MCECGDEEGVGVQDCEAFVSRVLQVPVDRGFACNPKLKL